MVILKIQTEEQLLIKFHVIKQLVLLKFQNMTDINVDLLQWFIYFLTEELHKPMIKTIIKEKYTHFL